MLDAFFTGVQVAERKLSARSELAEALRYIIKRRTALTRFATAGGSDDYCTSASRAGRCQPAHPPGQAVDRIFAAAAIFFGVLVLALLGAIIVSLIVGAAPALKTFGISFLWTTDWNPVTEVFGAFVPIYGTLVTLAIAMIIGVPLSLGVAVFLTELCPVALKRPIGVAIELLAAISSIIYGIWGFFVFAPLFQATAQPC